MNRVCSLLEQSAVLSVNPKDTRCLDNRVSLNLDMRPWTNQSIKKENSKLNELRKLI